jgi:hypothetical protein
MAVAAAAESSVDLELDLACLERRPCEPERWLKLAARYGLELEPPPGLGDVLGPGGCLRGTAAPPPPPRPPRPQPGAASPSPPSSPSSPSSPSPPRRAVASVAGITFGVARRWSEARLRALAGRPVELRPEPENPHDREAIAVHLLPEEEDMEEEEEDVVGVRPGRASSHGGWGHDAGADDDADAGGGGGGGLTVTRLGYVGRRELGAAHAEGWVKQQWRVEEAGRFAAQTAGPGRSGGATQPFARIRSDGNATASASP